MACDICGQKGVHLEELTGLYKTKDIQHICSECEKAVNDHLWKLREMARKQTCHFMKLFMKVRAKNHG